MLRMCPSSILGFTLLEIVLALIIALALMGAAVPAVTGALGVPPARQAFERFDALVREARARSLAEGCNYVIVWGRDREVLVRPEASAHNAKVRGVARWEDEGRLELRLPAALMERGTTPEAIWTFWPDGANEPAEIHYKGKSGEWTAIYSPFAVNAEVRYE